MRDLTIYEIQFQEHGNPTGPNYYWFSRMGQALEFMSGITKEAHISEMTFRAHVIAEGAPGVAQFLNHLTGDRKAPADEIPF